MIKIYNEMQLAKQVDNEGLWIGGHKQYSHRDGNGEYHFDDYFDTTELRIYCRYLRGLGYTYKPMLEKVKEKIHGWDKVSLTSIGYKGVPTVVKNVCNHYKKGEQTMREINGIWISQEAKDFFVALYRTECEEAKRKNRKISKFGINEVKILFTLYVWTQIQKQYTTSYNYINMKGFKKKLKQDAHATGAKTLVNWMCLFNDSGYVEFPMGKNEAWVWKKEFGDSQDIYLRDLENCGLYIEQWCHSSSKLKECPNCGKLFECKSNNTHAVCEDCRREKERLKKQKYRRGN